TPQTRRRPAARPRLYALAAEPRSSGTSTSSSAVAPAPGSSGAGGGTKILGPAAGRARLRGVAAGRTLGPAEFVRNGARRSVSGSPAPAWLLLAAAAAGASKAGDLRGTGGAVPSEASMLAGSLGAAMGCAEALAVSCEGGPAPNPTNASTLAANSAPPSASMGSTGTRQRKASSAPVTGEVVAHT